MAPVLLRPREPRTMTWWRRVRFAAAIGVTAMATAASPLSATPGSSPVAATPSGQNDFAWEVGTWTTKVKVRRNPLTGEAPDWVEYEGSSIVRPLFSGRANFVELRVSGARGKIEGGSLRLYNPQTHQWNVNYAGLGNGQLTAPVYGGFGSDNRGVFYGQDMLDGKAILVRFIITRVSPNVARFEQAYSANGGVTWEDNWLAVDTRR